MKPEDVQNFQDGALVTLLVVIITFGFLYIVFKIIDK